MSIVHPVFFSFFNDSRTWAGMPLTPQVYAKPNDPCYSVMLCFNGSNKIWPFIRSTPLICWHFISNLERILPYLCFKCLLRVQVWIKRRERNHRFSMWSHTFGPHCMILYDTENFISLSQCSEISIPYKPYGAHRHHGSQLLSERTITASSALTISPDDRHRFTWQLNKYVKVLCWRSCG